MANNPTIETSNLFKTCNMCQQHLPLDRFGRKKRGSLGVKARCKKCLGEQQKKFYSETPEYRKYHNQYTNRWRNDNKERASEIAMKNKVARRGQKIRRRTLKSYLPNELTAKDLKNLLNGIPEGYHVDHFLPLSIGHGGTYLGNLIVVPSNWNVTKSAKNPFEWCDEYLNSQDKGLYMTKVADLARLNNMTLDEYKEFTFWCFDNPRTIDELQKELEDNGSIVDSINLFRKKTETRKDE